MFFWLVCPEGKIQRQELESLKATAKRVFYLAINNREWTGAVQCEIKQTNMPCQVSSSKNDSDIFVDVTIGCVCGGGGAAFVRACVRAYVYVCVRAFVRACCVCMCVCVLCVCEL